MPVDTAQKRASALTFNAPYRMPAVPATGSFDQADRQHTLWNYMGILAVVPAAPVTVHIPTVIPVTTPGRQVGRVLVSWVRVTLDEWQVSVSARSIPEHVRVRAMVPALRGQVQARLIAVSRIEIAWQVHRSKVLARLEGRAVAETTMVSYISKAEVELLMGMAHVQRLLDDEMEIAILLGKV